MFVECWGLGLRNCMRVFTFPEGSYLGLYVHKRDSTFVEASYIGLRIHMLYVDLWRVIKS